MGKVNAFADGTSIYTWQNGRELAAMTDGDTTWTYTYDANGMRISRTNGTKTYNYVYNGSQLTQMTVGNDTLYFTYGILGPTTVTWNGTTYYYALNAQGDVIGIYDEDGNLVVVYNWDNAWGYNPIPEGSLANTLGTLNPLRYRGYVYDTETGYYYLQSRYYNPEIGRFINADALVATGQGLLCNNMFAYCYNNPLRYVDDTGTVPAVLVFLAITLLGGVVYGATTDRNLSKELSSQQDDESDYFYRLAPAPRPNYNGDPPKSPLADPESLCLEERSPALIAKKKLTTEDRLNNIVISGTFTLMLGGALTFVAGAGACIAGQASVFIPLAGATGKQIVAWGLLAHDVFPIIVAPFLGWDMEVLEYPQ